ncbi:MAG TPA: sulfite exporter TauE/SafE family protein, partial [Pseudobdellovibrionaceae bacterium]|nr:sulfite exporter TauE/SafE family protein [Pseudobdellovibrionaceae bacterium]
MAETQLLTISPLSSTYSHNKSGAINWNLVKKIAPGLILGCFIGAYFGHILSNRILQLIFAVFAILLGFYFFRHKEIPSVGTFTLPSKPVLNSYGFGVGALSNILGIGGGTMTVP